jgi:hypothetical protein
MATKQEIAKEMLKLFDGKPERWTRGAFARAKDPGFIVSPLSDDATCWCLWGAVRRAADDAAVSEYMLDVIESTVDDGIAEWNDRPGRTFDDVQKLLKSIAEEP